MAATRKLQGEIDRCLKKVTEGVETFEDIWQKVHNATNSNQKVIKEKYEADLKKEIKKLQRLRDQIKSWIASAEIKDKTSLLDNRRLIETQMERFKVVERETKTKAYSKEGLGAAQKLDPAQREKEEISCWLQTSISALQIQTDQFESEIEGLLAGKKKRLDKEKQDKMDDLKAKLDRHKFHVTKLETLLRMLDNDGVDVDQIKKIKDDVEYYIESSQEPDFEENEYLYDDITGLEEVEMNERAGLLLGPSGGTTESNNSNDEGGSPSSINSSPCQSPINLNCSTTTTHNHNSSESVDYSDTKKNKQPENAITNSKPVKPTAIRPVSKLELNNSLPSASIPLAPLNTLASSFSAASSISATYNNTPAKNNVPPIPPTQPSGKSVQPATIQPITAPIAFAAVAKQNPANLENGPISAMHATAATSTSTTLISNQNGTSMNIVSSATQPQQPPAPSQAATQHTSVSQASTENHVNSSSNSMSNCVSPTSNSTNASRTSHRSSPATQQMQQLQISQPIKTPNCFNCGSLHATGACPQASVNMEDSNRANLYKDYSSEVANAVQSSQQPQMMQQQQQQSTTPDSMASLKKIAQEVVNRTSVEMPQQPAQPDTRQQQLQQAYNMDPTAAVTNGLSAATLTSLLSTAANSSIIKSTGTNEALIPPLLGVAPLGPSPLQKEHQVQFQMMEATFYHLPQNCDSERLRPYIARQPTPTPPHFPQTQLPHSDTIEFFQRLSTETLFFVFYYMEGTKAQYLAAKALKKQSWRFHTKYMMWFQRHEEPKIINEDFEQGTYIYFDYEKWGQRKKEGFTFEYKYLEDKELN